MARGFGSIYKRRRKLADGSYREVGPYYIQYCYRGKIVKEASHTEVYEEAAELLKRRLESMRKNQKFNPKLRKILVGELLDDLLTFYRNNSPETLDFASAYITNHLRPAFGELRASEVSTDSIEQYKADRLASGLAPASINRSLALLRRAFRLAHKATPPKVEWIPYFEMLKEDNIRKGFFEREELDRLLKHLPEALRPLTVFAYYTGCRSAEIRTLQWHQVDLDRKLVRLDETKNGDIRLIPLDFDELYESLLRQKALRDTQFPNCPWVFFWPNGSEIRSFKESWTTATTTAGLPGRLFHDLRRTGVRNLRRAGVDRDVIRKITGHRTDSVFSRYNIVAEDDLHAAAAQLNAKLRS